MEKKEKARKQAQRNENKKKNPKLETFKSDEQKQNKGVIYEYGGV